jgi:hypothetical protein
MVPERRANRGGPAGTSIIEAPDTLDATFVKRLRFTVVIRDKAAATTLDGPRSGSGR